MTNFVQIGARLGNLVEEKYKAYGDSIGRAAAMLAIQHPNGLRPDQYADALIDFHCLEKQLRFAHQRDTGVADPHGEDPRLDRAGYALLGLHERKESPCHEGSAKDVDNQSPAQPDSAAHPVPANATTITSASAKSEKPSTPPSSDASTSSSVEASSAAPAATGAAVNGNGDGFAMWPIQRDEHLYLMHLLHLRNSQKRCAFCTAALGMLRRASEDPRGLPYPRLLFCSDYCAERFEREVWR